VDHTIFKIALKAGQFNYSLLNRLLFILTVFSRKYHPDRNKERPESAEKMNSTLYRLDIDRNEGCET